MHQAISLKTQLSAFCTSINRLSSQQCFNGFQRHFTTLRYPAGFINDCHYGNYSVNKFLFKTTTRYFSSGGCNWIQNNNKNNNDNANESSKGNNLLEQDKQRPIKTTSQIYAQKLKTKTTQMMNSAQQSKNVQAIYEKSKDLQKKIITEPMKKIIPKHENIYTTPNFLTLTRLIAAPAIGYFIMKNQISIALPLFIYSCVTDFIDGMIARKYNLKTIVGSIIDPMADKLLMIITTASLALSNEFPLYLASLILGKDIFMGLLAIVIRYRTLPAPKTFWRYWDFSIPSVKVTPTMISKFNTGFQMVYITITIFKPVICPLMTGDMLGLFNVAFEWYGYFVGLTTVLGGGSYLVSTNAVKAIK